MRIRLLPILLLPATLLAQQDNTIHVVGHGEVLAEPDVAAFTFAIQGQAASPDAAKERADEIAGTLVSALESLGVPSEDLRSTPVMLSPFVDPQTRRELIRFNRTTSVTLRDLELFEDVEAAALEAGINSVGAVQFSLSNAREPSNRAIEMALEDARARAELIANAIGVGLGPVLSVAVSGSGPIGPQPMRELALAAEAGPGFRFGVTQISADLEVRYAIERR